MCRLEIACASSAHARGIKACAPSPQPVRSARPCRPASRSDQRESRSTAFPSGLEETVRFGQRLVPSTREPFGITYPAPLRPKVPSRPAQSLWPLALHKGCRRIGESGKGKMTRVRNFLWVSHWNYLWIIWG